jgi:ribonuclease BN (tRNA processing enzyme)
MIVLLLLDAATITTVVLSSLAKTEKGIRLMQITFLGTGAALGTTTENNSSVVIDKKLLLDAGMAVPHNLMKAGLDADDLEAVILTHFDPDHVIGLPLLIMRRSDDRPLLIIGPEGTGDFVLNLCDAVGKAHYEEKLYFVETTATANEIRHTTVDEYSITPVLTEHEDESQGYLITDSSGFTLFFSGDSALCEGLEQGISLSDAAIIEMTELEGRHDRHLSMEYDMHVLFSQLNPAGKIFLVHRVYPRQSYLEWIDGMELGADAARIIVPEELQTFSLNT